MRRQGLAVGFLFLLLQASGSLYAQAVNKPYIPSGEPIERFKQFQRSYGENWVARWDPKTDAIRNLQGKTQKGEGPPEEVARHFLEAGRDLFRLDPRSLQVKEKKTLAGKHHIIFQQLHEGIPVEGAAVKVHLTKDNEIYLVQSSFLEKLPLVTTAPSVTSEEALTISLADLGVQGPLGESPSGKRPKTMLVFYPEQDGERIALVWKVEFSPTGSLGGWVYFVDAGNGKVLSKYNDLRT